MKEQIVSFKKFNKLRRETVKLIYKLPIPNSWKSKGFHIFAPEEDKLSIKELVETMNRVRIETEDFLRLNPDLDSLIKSAENTPYRPNHVTLWDAVASGIKVFPNNQDITRFLFTFSGEKDDPYLLDKATESLFLIIAKAAGADVLDDETGAIADREGFEFVARRTLNHHMQEAAKDRWERFEKRFPDLVENYIFNTSD